MKLIDKSVVVAEIERIKKNKEPRQDWHHDEFDEGYLSALDDIKAFLDTLEMKEVDLEKEFDKCCENYTFDDECDVYTARHFFELGLKPQKGE